MTRLSIQQAFDLAIKHQQAGHFREAEKLYRQILDKRPNHARAMQYLGVISHELGQNDLALDLIRRAISLTPDDAEAHGNLGLVLRGMGQLNEAIACYQQVLVLKPDSFQAYLNLGHAWRDKGDLNESIAAFERALALCPDDARPLCELADALVMNGQFDAAVALTVANAKPRQKVEAQHLPMTQAKVFAVCSIRNGPVDLLPHWLDHYSNLGVNQILIGLFEDITPEARAQIDACASRYHFTCFNQTWKEATESSQEEQRRAGCRVAGAQPDTWILHTDLDEFHEFPAPLPQIISAADAQGINIISGWLLDRVAADGSLPLIHPSPPSLFDQFPVTCRLGARILRSGTWKIMLAHFSVPVTAGHHFTQHAPLGQIPLGCPEQYIIHHFKWHADLLSRLQWSLAQPNTSERWRTEATRFLAWLKTNGGKINLDECRT